MSAPKQFALPQRLRRSAKHDPPIRRVGRLRHAVTPLPVHGRSEATSLFVILIFRSWPGGTSAQPGRSAPEPIRKLRSALLRRLRTSPQHAAPLLTTIGYINWWQGRGSKAHQYMQLALDTDPGYRFARLSDQMLGAGIIAGWNTNRDTAYKTQLDMP
ncbi:DUF4192 family protein [Paenarthrobacter sp. RAF54_2]|uniref:DUF4192 family protein n=1 Tax=Paenarthrobacter sp. RAF54_2 TaxID=3233061 RepID=UPI003F9A7E40